MTLSYEPETRFDASAQELLDSLNFLIIREARKVATRRPSDHTLVSSSDILVSLKKRQERARWRERGTFSLQVTLTAVAISATAVSFATSLSLGGNSSGSDVVSSSKSLLVTVLLATLLIVASATLFAIFRESKECQFENWRSRSSKAHQAPSSRCGRELALLSRWSGFEELMKRELYANPSDAPIQDLSGDIVRFSRLYDLDPEEIRSILRARNAVAHDPRSTSAAEVRESLLRLRSLTEKLSLLRSA